MLNPTILFIALRYIRKNTVNRFGICVHWVSIISITLGIMSIVIILSVMNGFEREFKNSLIYSVPHVLLTTTKGYVHSDYVPYSLLNTLNKTITGNIQPLVLADIILQSSTQVFFGSMIGVDTKYISSTLFNCSFLKNNIDQLINGKYYVILGYTLAKKLRVNINDQIRLIVPSVKQITPVGYIPSQRLFTVLDIYITNNEIENYQVLVHQCDAAKLMHYPVQCVTGWRLWLHSPFTFCNNFNSSQFLTGNWIWKDWRENKKSILQAIKMEKNIIFALLGLIIIASGFNVISFLVLLIMEKQLEIAILKTCGFTSLQIVLLFMIQGIINGMYGIVLGVGLGILFSYKWNYILFWYVFFSNKLLQLPIEIKYFQILKIIIITFIIIILSTLYPVWRISSINPSEILRRD